MENNEITASIVQHHHWQGFELEKLILRHADGQTPALFFHQRGTPGHILA